MELYECPTCERDSAAFVTKDGAIYCPACAPVPDKKPHDFKPVATGGVVDMKGRVVLVGETGPEQYARTSACDPRLVLAYVRNDVCCLDPGDCAGPCGDA